MIRADRRGAFLREAAVWILLGAVAFLMMLVW